MTGLYFYKLVSPYEDDVTKDCKLTVNEIDHNFITLKDADIEDAVYDELSNKITLTRNNGDTLDVDLSPIVDDMTSNLEVDYDSIEGTITISYNDKKVVIDGIITKDNLSKEILTEVITDSSLKGKGTNHQPLGMSLVEKTGMFTPAKKFIDLAKGEFLPKPKHLTYGDSFVVFEKSNDYGFLYNYNSVKRINEELSHGWRVPSKADWDSMLNAVEPCDKYKTHASAMANTVLGKFAGKLLKSKTKWLDDSCPSSCCTNPDCECEDCKCNDDYISGDDYFDAEDEIKRELKKKEINPHGIDAFKMGIIPAGYGDGCRVMAYFGKRGEYWTSTITDSLDVYTKRFDSDKAGVCQYLESPSALYSLRLVKDYDGQNFHEVESINGQDYPCILMPSENSEHGFAIWTAVNIAFSQTKYCPVLPNNGEGLDQGSRRNFFIYSWTGFDFVKKQLKEGDAIVLERGLKDEYNGEYRLMHGELVNTSSVVYDDIMAIIEPRLDKIEERLDEHDEKIEDINTEIDGIKKYQDELNVKIDQEILDRKQVDSEQWKAINDEIESRLQVDAEQWEAINNETSARTSVEKELWIALNNEATARIEVDKQQWEAINNEASARTSTEKELWVAINNESSARIEVDNQQWAAINNETSARTEVDNQQWAAINNETSARTEVDNQIWSAITDEISARTEVDNQQWAAINNETSARTEVDNQIWSALTTEIERSISRDDAIEKKIDDEIIRAVAEDEYIEGRLISKEGSTFDCSENGILTLLTDKPENAIKITLNGNYGTF